MCRDLIYRGLLVGVFLGLAVGFSTGFAAHGKQKSHIPYPLVYGDPKLQDRTITLPGNNYSGTPSLCSVSLHQDSTTFTLVPTPFVGVIAGDAVWCDYDGDGNLDVLVSGWNDTTYITRIYHNVDGAYADIQAPIAGLGTEHGVAWGDFDNDGDYDLALTGRLDTLGMQPVAKIYRNDGGSFVDIDAPLMQLNGGSVTWVDYDKDGDLDLFVCGSPDAGRTFNSKLYRNDNGVFTEVNAGFVGVWASSAVWGDYNNDGYPDLLLTGYGTEGSISRIYRNDGNDVFTNIWAYIVPAVSGTSAWCDYNNDGYLDIIVSGLSYGGPVTKIYRNTGDGNFVDIGANIIQVGVSSLAWGDFDNDGYPDLAISGCVDANGHGAVTRIYRNDNGAFVDIGAAIPNTWYGSLAWGDYDKDGRLDLLISGGTVSRPGPTYPGPYYSITSIYKNNLSSVDSIPTPPVGLSVQISGQGATLEWNPASDKETPAGALTYNLRVGTQLGGNDIVSSNSLPQTGFRRFPKPGNAGHCRTWSLKNLPAGQYYWSVQSVDNELSGSRFAEEKSFIVGNSSPYWAMISLPFRFSDARKSVLFPLAVSAAYTYVHDTGYQAKDTLQNGSGYWLKFDAARTISVSGAVLANDTIKVTAGWNMIGSISVPVRVPDVIQVPPDNIASCFFGYEGTYQLADTIQPMMGYWVKVINDGQLVLSASGNRAGTQRTTLSEDGSLDRLDVSDAKGNSVQLYVGSRLDVGERFDESHYVVPPLPPQGAFDARFGSDQLAALYGSEQGKPQQYEINIQATSYPLKVSWDIAHAKGGTFSILEGATGKEIARSMGGSGSVAIPDKAVKKLYLVVNVTGQNGVPARFALEQNYPNPFNPSTIVNYQLPSDNFVTLKVYTVLGQEVATLIQERQPAGYHSAVWDASYMPSGVYLCRMSAGTYTSVRKMVLTK